jgi:hypothetical protein
MFLDRSSKPLADSFMSRNDEVLAGIGRRVKENAVASLTRTRPHETHPLFRGVFDDWHTRAGVFSALPEAPVEPDAPQRQPWWRRLGVRRLDMEGGRVRTAGRTLEA